MAADENENRTKKTENEHRNKAKNHGKPGAYVLN